MTGDEDIKALLSDPEWRLDHLYKVVDKGGKEVLFRRNWAQKYLQTNTWYSNLILKARQIGITTYWAIRFLDRCIFNKNVRAVIVADTRENSEEIFRTKVRFPFDTLGAEYPKLHQFLKEEIELEADQGKMLVFENGSSFRVVTTARSGTVDCLLVSEYGRICAERPDRAKEIRTGSLNAVPDKGLRVIESTAAGEEGDFYEKCEKARAQARDHQQLSPLDWRFFFFPWWKHPEYRHEGFAHETRELTKYLDELDRDVLHVELGRKLELEQRRWYCMKFAQMEEEIYREHPSTPEEAFKAAIEGAYYGKSVSRAEREGRIQPMPAEPGIPVDTYWDIGMDDATAIWFGQHLGRRMRFVHYYEMSEEPLEHYIQIILEIAHQRGFVMGKNYGPHDLEVREWGAGGGDTRAQNAAKLGLPFVVTPRIPTLIEGVDLTRRFLQQVEIDSINCDAGIKALKNYKKKWDPERGVFKNQPERNFATHGASAMMIAAQNWSPRERAGDPRSERPGRARRRKPRAYNPFS